MRAPPGLHGPPPGGRYPGVNVRGPARGRPVMLSNGWYADPADTSPAPPIEATPSVSTVNASADVVEQQPDVQPDPDTSPQQQQSTTTSQLDDWGTAPATTTTTSTTPQRPVSSQADLIEFGNEPPPQQQQQSLAPMTAQLGPSTTTPTPPPHTMPPVKSMPHPHADQEAARSPTTLDEKTQAALMDAVAELRVDMREGFAQIMREVTALIAESAAGSRGPSSSTPPIQQQSHSQKHEQRLQNGSVGMAAAPRSGAEDTSSNESFVYVGVDKSPLDSPQQTRPVQQQRQPSFPPTSSFVQQQQQPQPVVQQRQEQQQPTGPLDWSFGSSTTGVASTGW